MSTLHSLWVSAWMFAAPSSAPATLPVAVESPEVAVVLSESPVLDASVSGLTMRHLEGRLRRLAEDEDRLGERRRLRLWIARSYLTREELGALPHEDPFIEEDVEEIIGSCVVKLLRSRLEEEVGLRSLRRRYDERRHGATGDEVGLRQWSLSPRVGFGHDPWLGSKLRWRVRGESPTWRRPSIAFGVKRHLLHDELAVAMELQSEDVELELEHISDGEFSGDVYQMSLRWRF